MDQDGTWGTNIEMLSLAHLLPCRTQETTLMLGCIRKKPYVPIYMGSLSILGKKRVGPWLEVASLFNFLTTLLN